jgi:hypothetical protein
VLVESFDSDATRLGLAEESVRTDVELMLREAGFKILPLDLKADYAALDVSITVTPGSGAAMAYLWLIQDASIPGIPYPVSVTTWQSRTILGRPTSQGIRNAVKNLLGTFLNNWLTTNLRERTGDNAGQQLTPGFSLAIQHQ